MFDVFWFAGIIGLVLIISGLFAKTRKQQSLIYVFGGIFLEIYSIYIGDSIFIALQGVFTIVALYEFYQYSRKKESWFRKFHLS
ncbi:MAG: hypothetical protein JW716_03375 [Candidatus Aenigmarchaeota archaeon]|nr:hypothetical protein [Candidatus Aenigmarchaeota archaeon]